MRRHVLLFPLSSSLPPLPTAREPLRPGRCTPCEDDGEEDRPLEEGDLVERARQGETAAYEALVRGYEDVAFRTAYLITGDAAEAEDAAQDAAVKAFYALPRFRAGAPFRPWLLRIVANEARNRRKARGRRDGLALRAAAAGAVAGGTVEPSPEQAVLAAERRERLRLALDGLREEDRLVIAYRYFFDLSEAEMATALDCARGTVKSRLSRALARLRDRLGSAGAALFFAEGGEGGADD